MILESEFFNKLTRLVEGEEIRIFVNHNNQMVFQFRTFGSVTHTAITRQAMSKEILELMNDTDKIDETLGVVIENIMEITEENIKHE